MNSPELFYVYRRCDTYCTAARQGQMGTSPVSAEAAARDLAGKIFGDRPHSVTLMGHPARADIDIFEMRELVAGETPNDRGMRPAGSAWPRG